MFVRDKAGRQPVMMYLEDIAGKLDEGMMLDIKRASKTETRKGSNKHRKKMKLK